MRLNNIGIAQRDNVYGLYLPQQIVICYVSMPPDRQYMSDMKALDIITKALALRWDAYKGNKQ